MHTAFFRRVQVAPVSGCWAKRPFGRLAILGGALLVSQVLVPSGARAQTTSSNVGWVFDHDEVQDAPANVSITPAPANAHVSGVFVVSSYASLTRDGITLKASGKKRSWFRWNSGPDNLPVPDKLKLLRTFTGTVYCASDASNTGHRMSDKEHLKGTFLGQSLTVDSNTDNKTSASLNAKVLGEVDTNGNMLVAGPWADVNVTASLDGERTYPGEHRDIMGNPEIVSLNGTVYFQGYVDAAPDDRSINLSRGGRGEYSKLENGEWHTYGDSIYSVKNTTSGNDELSVPLDITVAYLGGWTTTLGNIYYNVTPTWSKSGFQPESGNGDSGHNEGHGYGYTAYGSPTVSYPLLPPTGPQYSGSPTGGKTFDTSYTAKDNGDQATATAYYHLTLHDPVETIKSDSYIYPLEAPMLDGSGAVLAWAGGATGRPATQVEQTVKIGSSTEVGLDFTATTSVDALKGLLGFEAKAHLSSTKTMSIETEAKVPGIVANSYVYLIAMHSFQRTHVCFNQYDQAGKVKCFLTKDATGATLNPPQEVYQEAFRDFAFVPQFRWSDAQNANKATSTLPHDTVPPFKYDYSGHRS